MPLKLKTPSASTPRTCPLSIRTTGVLVEVDCADAAPSIAAAASTTAKTYLKILGTRGSSQWGYENGDAPSIFARNHRLVIRRPHERRIARLRRPDARAARHQARPAAACPSS